MLGMEPQPFISEVFFAEVAKPWMFPDELTCQGPAIAKTRAVGIGSGNCAMMTSARVITVLAPGVILLQLAQ